MIKAYEPTFLVDFMLGRLAKWLRVIGYDTVYSRERNTPAILVQSLKENRVLVTRDHRLSRKKCWRLLLIKDDLIADQLKQVVSEMNLEVARDRFFTRCTVCNGPIYRVEDKRSIKELVPEYVFANHGDFCRCPNCGKVYWQGTHLDLLIKDLTKAGIRITPP